MGKISVMSDILASQVAAGEVVERPASVIKELVENSIDAGSQNIRVSLQRGGRSFMQVIDDGIGMSRNEALLAIERHASSKLKNEQDLKNVRTLGFRGEALPSIASVSKFQLITCEPNSKSGTKLSIKGGKLVSVAEAGSAPGTSITVSELFYNVPARRKFLRTIATEYKNIENFLRLISIAFPEIALTLLHENRLQFRLPGKSSLLERIRSFVGSEIAMGLIELPKTSEKNSINGSEDEIAISGYISDIGHNWINRKLQFFFVNNRHISDRAIQFAANEAYRGFIDSRKHPILFLKIDLPPSQVDVNVHPAKREVRFAQLQKLQGFIQTAIARTLHQAVNTKKNKDGKYQPRTNNFSNQASLDKLQPDQSNQGESLNFENDKKFSANENIENQSKLDQLSAELEISAEAGKPFVQKPEQQKLHGFEHPSEDQANFRVIGIFKRKIALLESDEGLVMLDYNSARERIFYENLLKEIDSEVFDKTYAQELLIPITAELLPTDYQLVVDNKANLSRLGFGIEPFGRNVVKIESLPACLQGQAKTNKTDSDESNPEKLLMSIVADVRRDFGKSTKASQRQLQKKIAKSVAKLASRNLAPIAEQNINKLLQDLLNCQMPYLSPSGKPTLVQYSTAEINKKFGK